MENGHCSDHQTMIGLVDSVKKLTEDTTIIKDALLGTMDEEGWLSKIRTLESKMAELEKQKGRITGVVIGLICEFIMVIAALVIGKLHF